MGLVPQYKILANAVDITTKIAARLMSLRLTDQAGLQSDTLEITLADNDPQKPIAIPEPGAELELFLGYDGELQRMGLFVFDDLELSGWPGVMVIHAKAAVYDKSKGGKSQLQTQKSRTWPANTKLVDMVAKIAKEHGMEWAVSPSLNAVSLPTLAQTDESDLHFLTRVTKKYDAVVKPAGGKLVVAKQGETKSASGEQLAAVILTPFEVSSWSMSQPKREVAGQVVAYWHDVDKAKRQSVTVGEGEPVTRLKMYYPTQDIALAAASAELEKRNRAKRTVSLTLPGRPTLQAEAALILQSFREGVAGEWVITKVEHSLNGSGYVCSINASLPGTDEKETKTKVSEE